MVRAIDNTCEPKEERRFGPSFMTQSKRTTESVDQSDKQNLSISESVYNELPILENEESYGNVLSLFIAKQTLAQKRAYDSKLLSHYSVL